MAFPQTGKDKETDEWRKKFIVCVGRSDDSFNPHKQHICMAHFEQSSLLFHGEYIYNF